MVTLNKSGTDQRIPLRKLTLYNAAPRRVQRHSELKIKPPEPQNIQAIKMPKRCRDSPAKEDAAGPLGVTNPRQAEDHKLCLDQAIEKLRERAMEEEIEEIMGPFINEVKEICSEVYAPMEGRCEESVTCPWRPLRFSPETSNRRC